MDLNHFNPLQDYKGLVTHAERQANRADRIIGVAAVIALIVLTCTDLLVR